MDSTPPERQTSPSIPVVDKQVVDEIVMNKKSGLPRLVDDYDARYPELGNVLFREYSQQGDLTASRVTYGALIAGLLLEVSQQRVGGLKLESISEGLVEASLVSLAKNSDEEMLKIYNEAYDSQKELFRGLDFFAQIAGVPPNEYRLGGILMLQVYKHLLKRKNLS